MQQQCIGHVQVEPEARPARRIPIGRQAFNLAATRQTGLPAFRIGVGYRNGQSRLRLARPVHQRDRQAMRRIDDAGLHQRRRYRHGPRDTLGR